MIDFLSAHAVDPRLSFFRIDARNLTYSPVAAPMTPEIVLPIGDRMFDVICMFSVITHQLPDDARSLFIILRRYIRDSGRLFFSATLEIGDFKYQENFPDKPTAHSVYTREFLTEILVATGWRVVSIEAKEPRGLPIQDSLLCVSD
jgi:SAM-dependent methyltransferase